VAAGAKPVDDLCGEACDAAGRDNCSTAEGLRLRAGRLVDPFWQVHSSWRSLRKRSVRGADSLSRRTCLRCSTRGLALIPRTPAMTAPLFSSIPRLRAARIACAGGLLLCLLAPAVFAADVLVVTDSRHPVQSAGGARMIELDLSERIEAELAAGLPNDPSRAAALVQQRLRDGGQALQRRIGNAYQGVTDAWGLGIARVPAVVGDRRYVVYGEPNVARAVARIEAHRRPQP